MIFALSLLIKTREVKVKWRSSSAIVIIGTKGYFRKKFLFSKESVVQGRWIHLIPKWCPINCFFVCMLISLFASRSSTCIKHKRILRANKHANKRITYLPPFWNKVYRSLIFRCRCIARFYYIDTNDIPGLFLAKKSYLHRAQ